MLHEEHIVGPTWGIYESGNLDMWMSPQTSKINIQKKGNTKGWNGSAQRLIAVAWILINNLPYLKNGKSHKGIKLLTKFKKSTKIWISKKSIKAFHDSFNQVLFV